MKANLKLLSLLLNRKADEYISTALNGTNEKMMNKIPAFTRITMGIES